jgi:hypothetical protein
MKSVGKEAFVFPPELGRGGYWALPMPRWLVRARLKSRATTASMMKWTM